ncbi:WD40 repeat domain-containing protein [Vairimorpha necatrix]|uniref:WD40 repeat domain-containing protein n=1 Tax=Vairimorpha necatrix TaxID=6039 RepID=A0AAX4JAY1_9MICR
MVLVKSFPTSSCVGVILIHQDKIFTGSYDYSSSSRFGNIQLYSSDMSLIRTQETSGILDLKIHSSFLYAATSNSLLKFNLSLDLLKEVSTPHMNTFIYINISSSRLYICTSNGSITVYSPDLVFLYSLQVSNDILWTCTLYNSLLLCGGECSTLFFIKDKEVIKKMKFEQGICSLLVERDIVMVGSYDEHVYKIFIDRIIEKKKIGGGIWRIIKKNEKFYMSCMYEGIKILGEKNYSKGELVYGIDVNEEYIIYSSFYNKVIYKIKIN